MTVGELREILVGVSDNTQLYTWDDGSFCPIRGAVRCKTWSVFGGLKDGLKFVLWSRPIPQEAWTGEKRET